MLLDAMDQRQGLRGRPQTSRSLQLLVWWFQFQMSGHPAPEGACSSLPTQEGQAQPLASSLGVTPNACLFWGHFSCAHPTHLLPKGPRCSFRPIPVIWTLFLTQELALQGCGEILDSWVQFTMDVLICILHTNSASLPAASQRAHNPTRLRPHVHTGCDGVLRRHHQKEPPGSLDRQ